MQTVYVDVLFFINLFEDFLLILCTKRALRLNVRYRRMILGSAVGAVLSLSALLPTIPFPLNLLYKLAVCALTALAAFGFRSRGYYLRSFGTLGLVTFLFGGAMSGIYLAFKPSGMAILNDNVYFDISPALLIILTVIIYFILWIYRKLFANSSPSGQLHEVIILSKNNNFTVLCKEDSGLNVKEPFSGASVIIVERSAADVEPPSEGIRVIPFDSLGGSGIIYGFRADEVKIDGRKSDEEVYIGLCENVLKGEAKGLVPSNLFRSDT